MSLPPDLVGLPNSISEPKERETEGVDSELWCLCPAVRRDPVQGTEKALSAGSQTEPREDCTPTVSVFPHIKMWGLG